MDIQALRSFFMWCSIINVGLVTLSIIILGLAGDWVHRVHGKWFPLSREAFNTVMYSLIGCYKIIVFAFNIVPYVALCILAP